MFTYTAAAKVLNHLVSLPESLKTNLTSIEKWVKIYSHYKWAGGSLSSRLCFFDEFPKISNYHSHKTFTRNHVNVSRKGWAGNAVGGEKLMKHGIFLAEY